MASISVVVCFAVLAIATATDVQQCAGKNIANLSENVQLIPCKKIPCKLKKGSDQHITITFIPDKDINSLTKHVTAEIGGLPVPFIGVDGTSACEKLYNEDGSATSCPLKAGNKYMYKDSFHVYQFYPNLNTKVHWELKDDTESITCFEVAAKIA